MNTYILSEKEVQELERTSINALIAKCLSPLDAIMFMKYKEKTMDTYTYTTDSYDVDNLDINTNINRAHDSDHYEHEILSDDKTHYHNDHYHYKMQHEYK